MHSWTLCSFGKVSGGDLVDWKEAQWELENMVVEDKEEEEICKPVR